MQVIRESDARYRIDPSSVLEHDTTIVGPDELPAHRLGIQKGSCM